GFFLGNATGDLTGLQLGSANTLDFWTTQPSGVWLRAMSLATNGYLGIGTSTPGTRLDVMGTALVYGGARRVMRAFDDTPMAAGVGAGVDFGGKYDTAGTYTQFA